MLIIFGIRSEIAATCCELAANFVPSARAIAPSGGRRVRRAAGRGEPDRPGAGAETHGAVAGVRCEAGVREERQI